MGISLRLLLLAVLAWILIVLCSEANVQAHLEDPDKTKVVLLFCGMLGVGLAIAVMVALWILPALGQGIGAFFFSPNVEIEHDPHSDAIARLAQGDPEGAIDVYQDILKNHPEDTLAISEIARICCRDLDDTARAAAFMEKALDAEWPHSEGSFLANRLVDIYLLQEDPMRARAVLTQIAQTMEGTKFAANALHRLHEIDRNMDAGLRSTGMIDNGGPEMGAADSPGRREEAG